MTPSALRAVALNCTLKPSPAPSSCEKLIGDLFVELARHDVVGEVIRVVDFDVKPGVTSDEGDGDDWPALRAKILEADIFVLGTPIWLGNPSSVCRRVLERCDAFLGETDDEDRMITTDRVACCAVVGNEDGAHMTFGQIAQGLSDAGFTIPPSGHVYWTGEAMGSTDYNDLEHIPEKVADSLALLASSAAHLARRLKASPYPA